MAAVDEPCPERRAERWVKGSAPAMATTDRERRFAPTFRLGPGHQMFKASRFPSDRAGDSPVRGKRLIRVSSVQGRGGVLLAPSECGSFSRSFQPGFPGK